MKIIPCGLTKNETVKATIASTYLSFIKNITIAITNNVKNESTCPHNDENTIGKGFIINIAAIISDFVLLNFFNAIKNKIIPIAKSARIDGKLLIKLKGIVSFIV